MKTPKILIVEDDEFSRGAMEKLLQSSGYETRSCADAEEALVRLRGEGFDILVSDLRLSGMDGFELIREAKVIQPAVRTILMTGLVNRDVKEKATIMKIDGLFHKPIVWKKLFSLLNTLSSSKSLEAHPFFDGSNKSKRKPIFRAIGFVFVFFLVMLFNFRDSKAEEPLYAQYRPSFRSDVRRDCSKSLSTILGEEQLLALKSLQDSFYTESIPLRKDLIISNFEFRRLVVDRKTDPKSLLDRQKKILELQSKLEQLSLSYQMKARSIFTNEQLDRLPWDCMLGMETGFGMNVGIGRGPRRGYRW
jgi:CheY-like chemotaxis protein